MLREPDGTWDKGREHAWTEVHAALGPREFMHTQRRNTQSPDASPRAWPTPNMSSVAPRESSPS